MFFQKNCGSLISGVHQALTRTHRGTTPALPPVLRCQLLLSGQVLHLPQQLFALRHDDLPAGPAEKRLTTHNQHQRPSCRKPMEGNTTTSKCRKCGNHIKNPSKKKRKLVMPRGYASGMIAALLCMSPRFPKKQGISSSQVSNMKNQHENLGNRDPSTSQLATFMMLAPELSTSRMRSSSLRRSTVPCPGKLRQGMTWYHLRKSQ